MLSLKEVRRRMVIAMGCCCAACGQRFTPDQLIIHHKGFDKGMLLGYRHPSRYKMLKDFKEKGIIPPDAELLCDDCNRKRHKYRPSFKKIFGNRQTKMYRKASDLLDEKLVELLTSEEKQRYEADLKRYLKAYPFLAEPVTLDLLKEVLLIKDVQVPRLRSIVLDRSLEVKDLLSAQKQLDALQRTMVLLFTRMGIGYTTRTRRKQPKKIRTPLEEQEEEEA